jgi:hypothetical protein
LRPRFGRQLDAKYEVADVDLVAFANDRRLRDLAAVDVSSVGALQVGDDESSVAKQQTRMPLGDVSLRKGKVIALNAADVDLRLVKRLSALGSAFLTDND